MSSVHDVAAAKTGLNTYARHKNELDEVFKIVFNDSLTSAEKKQLISNMMLRRQSESLQNQLKTNLEALKKRLEEQHSEEDVKGNDPDHHVEKDMDTISISDEALKKFEEARNETKSEQHSSNETSDKQHT
ncbi:hypothetical protein XYCOK13_28470 [Xylanibacillus composti]|uniref:Uncharacterized protein n=1 Tax=Xylanibacillus composti TaxID=1572762 RepID=A0A8J4H7K7_9BACL|nr:hypothetical protein [Xylanibacillus composti]GIQ70023.1 hypothetical protein XYCOK13_28470 [Xylanibacillus composti]